MQDGSGFGEVPAGGTWQVWLQPALSLNVFVGAKSTVGPWYPRVMAWLALFEIVELTRNDAEGGPVTMIAPSDSVSALQSARMQRHSAPAYSTRTCSRRLFDEGVPPNQSPIQSP